MFGSGYGQIGIHIHIMASVVRFTFGVSEKYCLCFRQR